MRDEKISSILTNIQCFMRYKLAALKFNEMTRRRNAIDAIQSNLRAFMYLKDWEWMKIMFKIKVKNDLIFHEFHKLCLITRAEPLKFYLKRTFFQFFSEFVPKVSRSHRIIRCGVSEASNAPLLFYAK